MPIQLLTLIQRFLPFSKASFFFSFVLKKSEQPINELYLLIIENVHLITTIFHYKWIFFSKINLITNINLCAFFSIKEYFHVCQLLCSTLKRGTKAIYCCQVQHVKFLLILSKIVVIYWTCHQSGKFSTFEATVLSSHLPVTSLTKITKTKV